MNLEEKTTIELLRTHLHKFDNPQSVKVMKGCVGKDRFNNNVAYLMLRTVDNNGEEEIESYEIKPNKITKASKSFVFKTLIRQRADSDQLKVDVVNRHLRDNK